MAKHHTTHKKSHEGSHKKSHKSHKSKKADSPWIAHVKKVAKDNNMKFGDALKIAAKTYKK